MLIPDKVRGRVFAFEFAILTLTQSLSIFGAGYFLDTLEWRLDQITFAFGSLGVVVFILWMLFFLASWKNLDKYEITHQPGSDKEYSVVK